MQVSIPVNGAPELTLSLLHWVTKKKGRLSQLETLVCKLNVFKKAIPGSCAVYRMVYNVMSLARLPYHRIRITKYILQDMSAIVRPL